MQAQFTMDPRQWVKANSEYARIIKTAETKAIRDVGLIARDKGREYIAAAGFSQRWQKSLVARFKPKSGISFDPEARIISTINYSDVFETGKFIFHRWLWMPLPDVPSIRGRPHMTPKQYIQNIGPLVFIARPGKPPMLGRQVRTATPLIPGRISRGIQRRGRQTSRGTLQTIPLFVAVDAVHIPKKFNVKAAVEVAQRELQKRYVANLETYK